MSHAIWVWFFLLLMASPTWAIKRYISTTGNDANSCVASQSTSTAKRNFGGASGALACMTGAGDVLQARGGTYTEDLTLDNAVPSGTSWTAGSFSTIEPFPSEAVTIASAGNSVQLTIRNSHYVLIRGFKFDGTNGSNNLHALNPPAYTSLPVSGVQNNISFGCQGANCAHHIRFENNEVYYSAYGPMQSNLNCDQLEIRNNYFHHHSKVENANGFYMGSKNTTFEGNRIETFGGAGIAFWQQSTYNVINPIIKNNILKNIGVMWASDSGNRDCCGVLGCVNCSCSSGANCNNRMPVGFVNIKASPIFMSRGDGGLIYNNVISNSVGGIQVSYGVNNCGVYHNTVFGNVVPGGGFGDVNAGIVLGSAGGGASSCLVRNNIVYQPGVTNPPPIANLGTNNTFSNNLCSSAVSGLCQLVGNPAFVSAPDNLQLTQNSPARDAGTTVSVASVDISGTLRPQGPAYDLGAYEFGAAPQPAGVAEAKYTMDNTPADATGHGHTGALTGGATFQAPGIIGTHALKLTTSGDYLQVPPSAAFRSQQLCMAAWINMTAVDTLGCAWTALGGRFGGLITPQGHATCWRYGSDGWVEPLSSVNVLSGSNRHVACTWDGSTLRGYVDNAQAVVSNSPATIAYDGTEALRIGQMGLDLGEPYNCKGLIDQVYIYPSACTPEGIANLFNEQPPRTGVVAVSHTGWYTAHAPEGAAIGTPDTSLNHVITNPLGIRWAIVKSSPGSITEFFAPYCRVLSGSGAVITDWTKVGNSFGPLGVRYLADSQIAPGQATSSLLPTDAGFTAINGLFLENPIDDVAPYNANQRLTIAQGQKADLEARFEFGAPLAAGQQVECRPQRENGDPFDSYAQQKLVQSTSPTSTRAGLHYTDEEVAIWQQRIVSGPFRDGSDDPGNADWTTLLANATAWRNAPSARLTGQVAATCHDSNTATIVADRRYDSGMMDSAFVYLLTGDTSYRDPVLAQLLLQVAQPGTNFGDTSRFCPANEQQQTLGTDTGPWIFRLLMAYDFIRPSVSAVDRTTIENWFYNSAVYYSQMMDLTSLKRIAGKYSDDYTCTGSVGSWCPGADVGLTHFGGPTVKSFHRAWNNISMQMEVTIAAIGILLDDPTLKEHAKRYFREWVMFGMFENGVLYDEWQWADGTLLPQRGFLYPASAVGSASVIADLFGRIGDLSLLTYATTAGQFGSESSSPKSLLRALQYIAGETNNTVTSYASTTATSDPNLRIDHLGPITAGGQRGEHVYLTLSNTYFRDPSITTAYTTFLPSGLDTSGYDPYKGPWGQFPAVRFMFGLLEGVIDPYSPTTTTPAATSLRSGGFYTGGVGR